MVSRAAENNFAVMKRNALLGGFTNGLLSAYSPLFIRGLGASALAIGGLSSVAAVASTMISFAGGFVADRVGKRNLVLFFNFIGVLMSFVVVFARDWKMLAITTAFGALGGLAGPAQEALTAEAIISSKKGVTKNLAIYQSIQMLPNIVTPLIGGVLLNVLGVDFGFRLVGFLGAIIGIFTFLNNLSLEETMTPMAKKPLFGKGGLSMNLTTPIKANIAAWGLIAIANSAVSPFYLLFAKEVVGIQPLQWGVIISAQTAGAIMFKIPGALVTDKIGKKKLMMSSVALNAIVPSLYVLFTKNYNDAFFYQMLLIVFGMFYGQASYALFILQIPEDSRARMLTVWNTANQYSRLMGGFMGGFLYDVNIMFPFFFFTLAEWAAVYAMMWVEDIKDT
ncbi:MAG: MFS transporter [Candidatus Aenigmarchaeota archaeon]|nr:MFS transporter [Candidatus Aenigmarchaeota archaeon]